MTKILIIGKKSFLGSNLKIYLSKFFITDVISYEQIKKKNHYFFNKYTHIINTAIHPKYIKLKYNKKFDLDFNFIKKFNTIKFCYVFFNTRKIYLPKENISEISSIYPLGNYAKNKLITEKYLKKRLKNKVVSLRISNVIGKRIFNNVRNNHKLFFDNFLNYKKKIKDFKILVNDDFKDFLSINQFCRIVQKIIKLNLKGVYNVSISEKIYLSEIIKWLDKRLFKKIEFTETSRNSFTLSNAKLLKKIKIKLTKNELKKFCEKLS